MRGALLRLYESASVALAIDLNGRENCGSNFVPSTLHTQVSGVRQVPICWILRVMPPIEVVLTVFREARTRSLLLRSTVIQRSLGGKMNRTFLVLALALLGCAGCRTMGPSCGQACGDSCGQCCESSHMTTMRCAPRAGGCSDGSCGCTHGNCEASCPGGNCGVFDRYQGSECGPQYPTGPYDTQACDSCNWGCNGHRHPQGYRNTRECYCQNDGCNGCQGQPNCTCQKCGRGYCCGGPGVGCSCCPFCGCGPSGDHNYNFAPGPPTAQTAYPYYTLRGPRDFLLNNPPSIGPY